MIGQEDCQSLGGEATGLSFRPRLSVLAQPILRRPFPQVPKLPPPHLPVRGFSSEGLGSASRAAFLAFSFMTGF